jgi:hypothetical protein
VANEPAAVAVELVALAAGYSTLRSLAENSRDNAFIQAIDAANKIDSLDPRVGDAFRGSREWSVHDLALFVVKRLLGVPGPLIDEGILAARLGVDSSSNGWHHVREAIDVVARYRGVFSRAWPRWWAAGVEQWWDETVREPNLSAATRVRLLTERVPCDGLSAARGDNGAQDTFWTVCAVTGVPLDPVDGVLLQAEHAQEWHDGVYASLPAVLSYKAKNRGFLVHPLERRRLAPLMKPLS